MPAEPSAGERGGEPLASKEPSAGGREGAPLASKEPAQLQARLLRLLKGTLVVAIAGGYLLILTLLLVHRDWRAALLALFFIGLAQFFRYIGDDVDRIGWHLAEGGPGSNEPAAAPDEATKQRQRRMHRLLIGLTQLPNVALAGHAYLLGDLLWAAAMAGGLVAIEWLHWRMRRVNRTVAFEQASFGFAERGLLDGPEAIAALPETEKRRVEERLRTLERMAEDGEISRKAYKKARDRARVRLVMEAGTGRQRPPARPQ